MKKRLLSFFIIACMVLTVFPTSVFAADINALLMDTAASNSNVEDVIEKEGSVPLPDSGTSTPSASSSLPNSTPPDSVSAPNSSTSVPDSDTSVPPASSSVANSSTSVPPASSSVANSGTSVQPASSSVANSSSSLPPDSISAPSSSIPKIDGEEKAEDEDLQAQLPSMMSGVLAEGTYGGCDWVVGDDNTLTISPTLSPADGLTSGVLPSPDEEEYHDVPWSAYFEQILKVVIKDGVKSGASLYYFLGGLKACTTMDLSGLDTTAATDMNYMFSYNRALKTITFGNKFDTSNVTNMGYMFNSCTELQELDLSGFNTAKVTNMEYMFYDCNSLQNLDLSGFNTAKVTHMGFMFYYCNSLQKLDLSGFNTAKVTNMVGMFNGCLALKTLNLGDNFDTSSVSDMSSMFHYCSALETLNFGDKFDTSAVDDMFGMFDDCTALKELDLSNFNTGKVSNMAYMFNGCTALEKLDFSNFNTGRADNMAYMFSGCIALKELDISKLDTSKVKDMANMFCGCTALEKLDLSNFNTGIVDDMSYMFSGCIALEELDISKLDTSKVEDMSNMFSGCTALKALDISNFKIDGIDYSTDIEDMLKGDTLILKTDYYKRAMNSGTTVITLYDKASKDDLTTKDLDGTETNVKYMPQIITASLNDIALTGVMSDTDAKAFFDTAKVFNNGTTLYNNENGYAYPGAQVTVAAKDANKIIETVNVVKTNDVSTTITVTNNTFTMPAYSVMINAVVKEKPTYLLTLADTGDNSYGGGKMNIGDTVKIYAGTKQGYRFIGWETTNGGILADTTSAETTFKMVNGPCTLIARWVAIEGHSGKKNPATGVGTEVPNNAMALALTLALASIGGTLLIAKKRKHN